MPVDPRIALGFQAPPPVDFGQMALQRAQSMNMLSQMRTREAELEQQNALANAMRGVDIKDPQSIARIAGMPGGASALQALTGGLTAQANITKAQAEAEKAAAEKSAEAFGVGAHFLSLTSATDKDLDLMGALIRAHGGNEDEARKIVDFARSIAPENRVQYLSQLAASNPDIRAAMDMFKPDIKEVKTGDKILLVDFNAKSPTYNQAVGEYTVNASPDAALVARTAAQNRANDLAIAILKEEGANTRAGQPGTTTTMTEDQSFYNVNRVLNGVSTLADLIKTDPKALKAGVFEAAAETAGAPGLANVIRNPNRQTAAQAYDDVIDALLYLSTGAAYNKEQRAGMISAYRPNFTDKPEAVNAKLDRLLDLMDGAKARSGANWTPEVEQKLKAAISQIKSTVNEGQTAKDSKSLLKLPEAAIKADITPELWNVMTPDERALFE